MRSSIATERAGIRTVSIVCTGFLAQARIIAKLSGLSSIALAEYPGHVTTDSLEVFRQKVNDHTIPQIITGLQGGD